MASGSRRRAAAGLALGLGAATLLLAVYVVLEQFPRGLIVLGCVAVALGAGWYGLLRRGVARLALLGVALVALAVPVVLLVTDGDHLVEAILIGVGLTGTLALARGALGAAEVWTAAHVDEDWQISRWGEDEEARARRDKRREEFDAAARVLSNLDNG